MANEIQYGCGLRVIKASKNVNFNFVPGFVSSTLLGGRGPYPGSVIALTTGTTIDLEQVLEYLGGVCWMLNKGPADLVVAGPFDPEMNRFLGFQDLLVGEPQTIRLSRYLGAEWVGTGTGSGTTPQTQFKLFAENVDSEVYVGAFDR